MRILFMGTPDFALFSLKALCEAGRDEIVGVVTQPDKPKGRGYTLTPPPVKVYAEERGIPVFQPATLKDGAFANELASLAPDLIAVVAYGKILPAYVLDYPKHGCINVHGSLLPAYRGAAPMQRAIMEGCPVTGITTMYMAAGLDTGDMLLKKEFVIEENFNFEDVHDGLGALGAEALLQTVERIRLGTAVREVQDDSLATYAAKIEKSDCLIDFSKDAQTIHNTVRGLSPIPLAFTKMPNDKLLKLVRSRLCRDMHTDAPCGTVISLDDAGDGRVLVACGGGTVISFERLLPEGKGQMNAADFIRGRRLSVGDRLGE
ncbi:MAG: methionyl-tRNA formyltransferase [Ruminococcaceae bacterium]|nr:methionyl-tRNA formyltransferase [Oscillospiraceae bacterium]